jgi:hypothetical protein
MGPFPGPTPMRTHSHIWLVQRVGSKYRNALRLCLLIDNQTALPGTATSSTSTFIFLHCAGALPFPFPEVMVFMCLKRGSPAVDRPSAATCRSDFARCSSMTFLYSTAASQTAVARAISPFQKSVALVGLASNKSLLPPINGMEGPAVESTRGRGCVVRS